MGQERRRFPRVTSLNIVVDQGRIFRTLDISRDGMQVEMNIAPPMGSRINVDLQLGENVVEVQGKVMRHVPLPGSHIGVGIEFERLAPRSERVLLEYLRTKG